MPLHRELFNIVILPVTATGVTPPLFQLSATRNDGVRRLISPLWTEPQIRLAFKIVDMPSAHIAELFRGNRMAHGGRDTRKLSFSAGQLIAMGLAPAPEREAKDAERG